MTVVPPTYVDILEIHAREFTNLEAGPEAGAVGFWFRATRISPQLAQDVWDAIIMAEHYTSLLPHAPWDRTPEQNAKQTELVAKAELMKQRVRDAERAQPGGGESHPI